MLKYLEKTAIRFLFMFAWFAGGAWLLGYPLKGALLSGVMAGILFALSWHMFVKHKSQGC